MVIADPAAEALALVARVGDDPGSADRAAALLLRRRFGTALPPPFVAVPEGDVPPVRDADLTDVPGVVGVCWRATSRGDRGALPAEALDRAVAHRAVAHPPIAWWRDQVGAPPSERRGVLVAGARGTVVAIAAYGPAEPLGEAGASPGPEIGEVSRFGVDPLAWRRGVGTSLLRAAEDRLVELGFREAIGSVMVANGGARSFCERSGWVDEGARRLVTGPDGAPVAEAIYRKVLRPA